MVCRRTCLVRCRTLPLTSTQRRDHITRCCANSVDCQHYRDEWSSRRHVWHTNLWTSTAPTYLSADIRLVSEHGRRHLRSSSYRTLAVPRTRTTLGDRSFAVAGPRVWNSCRLRQITSYGQFRQHRKTQLFTASKSQRIVTLDYCGLYKYSYWLT